LVKTAPGKYIRHKTVFHKHGAMFHGGEAGHHGTIVQAD
jgi:hypothetical protein